MDVYIPLIWFIAGILMILAEFIVPGFVIFFFGAGAVVLSILTFLIPGLKSNYILQLLIWLFTSGLTLGFVRKFFSKIFKGKEQRQSAEDEFINKTAVVIEPISGTRPGRVSFEGTTWKAITYNESIAIGDLVEILKKDNLTLIVTRRGDIHDEDDLIIK